MSILKKLDRSSKMLILISLIGIFLALGGFLYLNKQGADDVQGQELVAKVTIYQNDTRVKRSDNIHWYPVNQTTDCFANDLIFTGNESFATVEFPSGDKVTLHPNSLVSLSNNLLSLESGAIEVDLSSGAAPLQVESFGEKFTLKEKSKVRLIQNEKGQKIIPLNEAAKSIKAAPALQKFVENGDLSITGPVPGKLFPMVSDFAVQYQWTSTLQNKEFNVSFSDSKSKPPFLTVKATSDSVTLPLKDFPAGMIYWKVTSASGTISDESSFYVTKELDIRLSSPGNKDILPLSIEKASEISFEWNAPLEFGQKLQIALDQNFTKIVLDENASTRKVVKIKKAGTYFWRVGYVFGPNLMQWSTPAEFSLEADVVISPLEIRLASTLFDFALTQSYEAQVKDPNNCEGYQFLLLKDQQIISEVESKDPVHTFNKLEDGQYTFKVIGSLKGKPVVESTVNFEVKTSAPLKAPKIIKKNRRLFVKAIENFFQFIIPSAAAADDAVAPLSWEGHEGATTYEVEIAKTINGKAILKQQTTKTSVDFKVPTPGTYFWRVRYKVGERWSPFSEYDQINAEDKILLIENPIMVSPAPETNVNLESAKKGDVTFNWSTPYPEFEYSLEIYLDPTAAPLKVIPVKGNSKTLTFKNKPATFYWRVVAKSSFGNKTKNDTLYRFAIAPEVKPEEVKPVIAQEKKGSKGPLGLILNGSLSQTSLSYDQKIDNDNFSQINKKISFSGQTFAMNAELWPAFGNRKNGINLGLDYANLTSGEGSYKESELIAEYGRIFSKKPQNTHKAFFGFHYTKINLKIDQNTTSNFSVSYLSGRYVYTHNFNQKWFVDANAEILLLMQSDIATPSLRLKPLVGYKLKKNLFVNGFIGFEKNVAKPSYDESGVSGTLTITSQVTNYGVGVTWLH